MIPHNQPTIGEAEKEAAARVLDSRWLAQGQEVAAFEEEFCQFLGLPSKYAVAVSSGTAGLYLCLWVLKATAKKVKIPSYACSSLSHAVKLIAGEENLVDSRAD